MGWFGIFFLIELIFMSFYTLDICTSSPLFAAFCVKLVTNDILGLF